MIIIRPVEITDAVLTANDVPETDEAEFLIGTSYSIGDLVMVTTTGVHEIFQSLTGSNAGNQPEDDDLLNPVNWARVSATNTWAMFSDQINDQTEQATSIEVDLTPAALVNSMSFFGLDAATLRIVMDDPGEGVVYDTTFTLTDDSGVNDWYAWYFEPTVRRDTLAVLDLPPFASAVITVTISQPSGTAKIGLLTMGAQRKLGDTDYSTGIGIVDYSRKERDTFGNTLVIQRNFTKRADYVVTVDTNFVATVQSTLSSFRTTPITWIGDVDFPSTIINGYYRDFNVVLSNPTKSLLNISVEGLT